jgi:hypothetical protein
MLCNTSNSVADDTAHRCPSGDIWATVTIQVNDSPYDDRVLTTTPTTEAVGTVCPLWGGRKLAHFHTAEYRGVSNQRSIRPLSFALPILSFW